MAAPPLVFMIAFATVFAAWHGIRAKIIFPKIGLFVLSVSLGTTWFLLGNTTPVSDFSTFYYEATQLSKGFDWLRIMADSKSPSTIFLYSLVFYVFGDSMTSAAISAILIQSFQPLLLLSILANWQVPPQWRNPAALFVAVYPPSFVFAPVLSSDNVAITISLAAISLASTSSSTTIPRSKYFYVLIGLLVVAAYFSRTNVGLSLMVFLVALIWMQQRPEGKRNRFASLAFSILPIPVLLSGYFIFTSAFSSEKQGRISPNSMLSWLVATGTNRETGGRYSPDDLVALGFDRVSSADEFEAASGRAWSLGLERIFSDFGEFVQFALTTKMANLWGGHSDFFYWSLGPEAPLSQAPEVIGVLLFVSQVMEVALLLGLLTICLLAATQRIPMYFDSTVSSRFSALLLSISVSLLPFYILEVQHRYRLFSFLLIVVFVFYSLGNIKQKDPK